MYTQIKLPRFDVNESKATITEVKVHDRDFVKKNDILFIAEDTKAVNEITAQIDGYILLVCKEFDEKNAGDVIGIIFDSIEELESYHIDNSNTLFSSDELTEINATRKARTLAKKLGVNLKEIAELHSDEVIKERTVQEYFDKNKKSSNKSFGHVFKYDRERVVIIGAGKGAEVMADILLDDYNKAVVGLVDDNVKEFKTYDFPVLNCGVFDFPDKIDRSSYDTVIASMSANLKMMKLRDKIFNEYSAKEIEFTNAIARNAEIRRGVKIGKGNIIGAGCYIGTLTEIGNNNHISYGVNIGHHNLIGNCNLFAPAVSTSGSVVIGNGCIIPVGVSMVNRIKIGDNVILPAGYSVVNSLPSESVIKQKATY